MHVLFLYFYTLAGRYICPQIRQKNHCLPLKTVVPVWFGGDKRDRTADLLNAIQALSQLSYTPILLCILQAGGIFFCAATSSARAL